MGSFEKGDYLAIHEDREVWSTGYASNRNDIKEIIQEVVDHGSLEDYEIIDIEVYLKIPTEIKLIKELKVELE